MRIPIALTGMADAKAAETAAGSHRRNGLTGLWIPGLTTNKNPLPQHGVGGFSRVVSFLTNYA